MSDNNPLPNKDLKNPNKDLTGLSYTIPQRDLKHLGYKMLYNKEGYTLDIKQWSYTIWIWLAGKRIEVNDWYDRTYDVIEFYKANKDDIRYKDDDSIPIMWNFVTGEFIINNKFDEFDKVMNTLFDKRKAMDELLIKYKKFDRETYLNKANMDKLIIELEKLNPKMTNLGTPIS